MGAAALAWFPDFGDQLVEVAGGLIEGVLTLELRSQSNLEQLGRGKLALLELFVEVVGQVDLNTWHTPNYTHTTCGWLVQPVSRSCWRSA